MKKVTDLNEIVSSALALPLSCIVRPDYHFSTRKPIVLNLRDAQGET